jgi:hypothetical protein
MTMTRRNFLGTAAAGALATGAVNPAGAEEPTLHHASGPFAITHFSHDGSSDIAIVDESGRVLARSRGNRMLELQQAGRAARAKDRPDAGA